MGEATACVPGWILGFQSTAGVASRGAGLLAACWNFQISSCCEREKAEQDKMKAWKVLQGLEKPATEQSQRAESSEL